MALIIWGAWQRVHITKRHGVSAADFDTAWHDPRRRDLAEEHHEEHGPYFISIGAARGGRALKMVWRWHDQRDSVWPVTAYFPTRRRPGGRRRA